MPLREPLAWLARAESLAGDFAATAASHDRDASFPAENARAARASGWPALAVPAEHGGAGASLLEVCRLQMILGAGDTSSALGLALHHCAIGAPGPGGEGWPPAAYASMCARVVAQGALLNTLATEPDLGSPARGGVPLTSAVPRPGGGFRITGSKSWSTWLPALTHALVSARVDGIEPCIGLFLVDLAQPGVRRDPGLDAVALRASASGVVHLEGVEVETAGLLNTRHPDAADPRGPAAPIWFQLAIAATYLGTAVAARDAVAAFARERAPNARAQPILEIPAVRLRLGRIDAAVRAARVLVEALARRVDETPREHLAACLPDVGVVKVQATNLAAQAAEEAMRLAGGPGLLRDLPLERYWRDSRGGLVHPPLDDILFEGLAGRLARPPSGA